MAMAIPAAIDADLRKEKKLTNDCSPNPASGCYFALPSKLNI